MIPRSEFGGYSLDSPALGRLLDRQLAESARVDAALDALKIAPRPETKYVVRRKSDGFYFAAESCGPIGDVWIGNRSLAYRFDYMAIAELRILKFQKSAALFDVVAVQG
jgi:hypothetical protein